MSLIRSGTIVTLFTLLSRFVGLARELFIAYCFGASSTADSVNIAFKLPNLFRRVFGEGALSLVFVPIYNQKLLQSQDKASHFASKVFWMLGFWLSFITLVMELLMPQLMMILAPGFYTDPEKFLHTIFLCRITTPYLIFVCLCALFGGALNSHRKFALFAFVPSLVSMMIIALPLLTEGMLATDTAMALGVLLAGIIQIILMYLGARKAGIRITFCHTAMRDKDIKTLIKKMVPASMTAGLMQINLFISQSISSFLPGAVSILSYAERLYQFPLSMIGIAFGTVLLPELSRLYKQNQIEDANHTQNNAIKLGLFLSCAAALGMIMLAEPIVHLVYERGEFDPADTARTAMTLQAFAIGLPAFTLNKIFLPFFYAKGDTKRPMMITGIVMLINTAANIILMQFWGVAGIAAGSSLAAWCGVGIMYYYAHIQGFSISSNFWKFLLSNIVILICMGGCIYYLQNLLLGNFYNESLLLKITILAIIVFLAALSYFTLAYFLRFTSYTQK